MGEALQRYLQLGDFKNVKLVLRFLACLGDMLGDEGVAPILEALIEKLPSYQGDGNEVFLAFLELLIFMLTGTQGLLLAIVYVILITLPYALVSKSTFKESQAFDMHGKLEPFAKVRHPMQSLFDPFSGNAFPYRDVHCQGQNVSKSPI